ncbi:MAG: RNase adapter RapZ [Xanthomonadaceae bacterium]|nr:RNase adapter RapZ [Xanthomonadaceae bacterium]
MKLVIVSGLSGSGKSVALHTLEDIGFYCIDNLPIGLLGDFGRHITEARGKSQDRYAVGIDARNAIEDLSQFPLVIDELKERGLKSEILFLQASEDTLIKRFSETRRRHPLSLPNVPLGEAIKREAELLAPILERADLVIDTSTTNVHQLREIIRSRMDRRNSSTLSLQFTSFGFKHGVPKDADYVFDVRCLPNPHWEPRLRPLTGRDPEVRAYLESQESVERMYCQIRDFIATWLPHFQREGRSYLTVAIGCTGGQHRSVYLAERLAEHFRQEADNVLLSHRELG